MGQTAIKTRCPHCGTALATDYEQVGATVRCPQCQNAFVVTTVEFVHGGAPVNAAAAIETRGDAGTSVADKPAAGRKSRQPAAVPAEEKIGRFQILGVLGRGAFGVVYRARDPLLDRDVALKAPRFPPGDQKNVQRFLAEAKAAGKLRHPHIVAVYESGQAEGKLFIAAEYVEGETMAARIEKQRPDFRQSAQWVRSLAEALSYAHAQGIVHRDIKPQNVMLDANDRPQIMDFGLAKRLDQSSTATAEGSLLGTPAYMAPEQARGEVDKVGPHSDQYSLGTVLYELLTGRRPFEGPAAVVIANAAAEEPPTPRSLNPEIPPDLEAILLKSMDREPAKRYADAAQMANDLERWLEGEPVSARPLAVTAKLRRWARRRPLVAALTTAVALLLIVAAGGGVLAWGMTWQSKKRLDESLALTKAQTERTVEKTREAEAAAESARQQTAIANEKAEGARQKRAELEAATAKLENGLGQKKDEEQKLARQIADTNAEVQDAGDAADDAERRRREVDEIQARSAASRREIYLKSLTEAYKTFQRADVRKANRLLTNACPEEERAWEWRFLRALCLATEKDHEPELYFTLAKESREQFANRPIDPAIGRPKAYPPSWWMVSDEGRRMPAESQDPAWVNHPPVIAETTAMKGTVEAVSPTATSLLTTWKTEKLQLALQVWDMANRLKGIPMIECLAPFSRPDRQKSGTGGKGRAVLGVQMEPVIRFAFSQDGTRLLQFSIHADDAKPSPVRWLPVPGGEPWRDWVPENMAPDAFSPLARRAAASLPSLIEFYNERTSKAELRVPLESGLQVSPDGRRTARFDGKDLKVHIVDRQNHEEVIAFPSGLDPVRFLARMKVNVDTFDPWYKINDANALWSPDGNRLVVRMVVTSSYRWGYNSVQRSTAFGPSLRVPDMQFDCVIVLTVD